jgi:hypothetical protein
LLPIAPGGKHFELKVNGQLDGDSV